MNQEHKTYIDSINWFLDLYIKAELTVAIVAVDRTENKNKIYLGLRKFKIFIANQWLSMNCTSDTKSTVLGSGRGCGDRTVNVCRSVSTLVL